MRPDHPAILRQNDVLNYAELDRRSSRLANRLLALENNRSAPVAYLGANSPLVFEAWFAAAKAGMIFAPLNWRAPPAELADVLADAQPCVIFVDAAHMSTMQSILEANPRDLAVIGFDPDDHADAIDTWTLGVSDTDPDIPHNPADGCLLSYTSGTTGLPKGVLMSHNAFVGGFDAMKDEPGMMWSPDDVVAMAMPNFHLGGSFLSMQALMVGATVTVLPTFESGSLLATIERDRVTILAIVPTALQMLLDHEGLLGADVSTIRRIVYFGSPIGAETVRRAQKAFSSEFTQYYGTTETWVLTFLDNAGHDPGNPERLGSCGLPVPGVELRLVDGLGADVGAGEVGEVAVKSPLIFTEYWRNAGATTAAFSNGWYLTGDLARRDDDGYYYLVDRAKDMIVSGGENVYSAEVERAIARLAGVAMVAVVGLPDARWGESVVAVVATEPGAALTEEAIRLHCRQFLAGYKVPKRVVLDLELPLTANGKIHKPSLRQRLAEALSIYDKGSHR